MILISFRSSLSSFSLPWCLECLNVHDGHGDEWGNGRRVSMWHEGNVSVDKDEGKQHCTKQYFIACPVLALLYDSMPYDVSVHHQHVTRCKRYIDSDVYFTHANCLSSEFFVVYEM